MVEDDREFAKVHESRDVSGGSSGTGRDSRKLPEKGGERPVRRQDVWTWARTTPGHAYHNGDVRPLRSVAGAQRGALGPRAVGRSMGHSNKTPVGSTKEVRKLYSES